MVRHAVRFLAIVVVISTVLSITSTNATDDLNQSQRPTVSAEPSASATADQGPSVRQFMTPDGRIDINAIRSSGYQGPLDLTGVDVRLDPRGGASIASVRATKL